MATTHEGLVALSPDELLTALAEAKRRIGELEQRNTFLEHAGEIDALWERRALSAEACIEKIEAAGDMAEDDLFMEGAIEALAEALEEYHARKAKP